MIFRLTQKMAKKIKETPNQSCPAASTPYADWSAHLFTAARAQYVIVTNTASLYSIILHGRGITDASRFIEYTLAFMADYMTGDGFEFQFCRFIAPDAKEVLFSKVTDRRVTGSMNDLIQMAQWLLMERQLSPFEAAQKINQSPMSYLDYDNPREAFSKMKPAPTTTQP
jgi:hypothetical protein